MRMPAFSFLLLPLLTLLPFKRATAQGSPERGLEHLFKQPLAVASPFGTISEREWDNLWYVFPKPLRDRIERDPSLKQTLTLERYGLTVVPRIDPKRPIAFTVSAIKGGRWEMNCLVCHGGTIPSPSGPQFYLGAPATTFDIMTFVGDRIRLKKQYGGYLSDLTRFERILFNSYAKVMDAKPLNETRGAYNVWASGDAFMVLRKPNMKPRYWRYLKAFLGHPPTFGNQIADMDPPAWWNTQYRDRLWIDGFAPKEARMLSLILMSKDNIVTRLDSSGVFDDLLAYIQSVQAPKFPGTIDPVRSEKGRLVFAKNCASCHGSYDGDRVAYPNKTIDMNVVKTDPVRLTEGMTPAYRSFVKNSWIGRWGESDVRIESRGYMPPPLKGVWASAPYFHNGSVPTLYHVLFSSERPAIWVATDRSQYDWEKIGLKTEIASRGQIAAAGDANLKRRYFDTGIKGKSAAGHLFPERLSVEERFDVLEYLKTL